jgi:site-specific recombinase XerD
MSKQKIISRDYRDWFPNYKQPHLSDIEIPPVMKDYLILQAITNKPTSCTRVKGNIRKFHHFINEQNITLRTLKRKDMDSFLRLLHKQGLSPDSRQHAINHTRRYLRWLAENGHLAADPESLLVEKDCPKRISRLPRPFSQDIDRQVQQKFRDGNDIFYDGLSLMRATGIRVNELINLQHDCILTDYKQNTYLKVPLGKLNTERLVPVTKDTVGLIHKIQRQSKEHAATAKRSKIDRLIIAPSGRHTIYLDIRSRMEDIQLDLPQGTSAKCHQLRHSCATMLLNNGMSIIALKELLGHADIRMTLRYASVAPEFVRKEYLNAITKINKDYGPPKSSLATDQSNVRGIQLKLQEVIAGLGKESGLSKKKQAKLRRSLQRILLYI